MSERTHAELLISKAYSELSAISENSSQASVSLASIGNYEVSMFIMRRADLNGVLQFWLELFDHGTSRSVDSFLCHRIKDAAPVFGEFMLHAYLNGSPSGGSNEQ